MIKRRLTSDFRHFNAFSFLLIMTCSCTAPDSIEITPGVSWELAQHRARTISDVQYLLRFRIPEERSEAVTGQASISLELSDPSQPLVLDFANHQQAVKSVEDGSGSVAYTFEKGHIVIPAETLNQGRNEFLIRFESGDGPLNRRDDFLYTLLVPDRASEVFPCFDQPDLKAGFRLSFEAPPGWVVITQSPTLEDLAKLEKGDIVHPRTVKTRRPWSTYLFAFAAGKFSRSEPGDFFHRETDSAKVVRNERQIRQLHAKSVSFLEAYAGTPLPFPAATRSVLIPAFQYGGMEHPGAIFYRQSSLMLDESATLNQKLGRASLIAHETAHQWFGNLVTMEWFNDVWMKEVFANFMAAKIVEPSFPEIDHELRFLLAHHPSAYGVDRTSGANPIRQDLENLNEAGSLYGAIIYQKAPIVMKQLEKLMGEEAMRLGLQEYLSTYSFGNAGWPDLIEILDKRTELDLEEWSRVWVNEPGRPTVRAETQLATDGTIGSLTLHQNDPRDRGLEWTQDVEVLIVSGESTHLLPARIEGSEIVVAGAAGLPGPDLVLPDVSGTGYGLFSLDPESRDWLLNNLSGLDEPRHRAVAWLTLWDSLLEGEVAPAQVLELALRTVATETNELVLQRILSDLSPLFWRFFDDQHRSEVEIELERRLWTRLKNEKNPSAQMALFRGWRSIVNSPEGRERMIQVASRRLKIAGLKLAERDYTGLALESAVRNIPGWQDVLERQLETIENPDRRARLEFLRAAVSDNATVRRDFFESLAKLENRSREPWALDGLRYLNHPLRAEASREFLRPSLDLLLEIQKTGDIFFPKRWLDAAFSGHSSPEAAAIVQTFLDEHADYPFRLRGKLEQSADLLFRAALEQQ